MLPSTRRSTCEDDSSEIKVKKGTATLDGERTREDGPLTDDEIIVRYVEGI